MLITPPEDPPGQEVATVADAAPPRRRGLGPVWLLAFVLAVLLAAGLSTGQARSVARTYPATPPALRPPIPVVVIQAPLRADVPTSTPVPATDLPGGRLRIYATGSQLRISGTVATPDDRAVQLVARSEQALFVVSNRRAAVPGAPPGHRDSGFVLVLATRDLSSVQMPCLLVRDDAGERPIAGVAARCPG